VSAATVRTVGRAGALARPAPSRSGAPRAAGSTRATTRPTTRPAGSRAVSSRPVEGPRRAGSLRLVPPAPSRAARAPFVAVVVGLLALGLLGLLALNTSLAESSFRLHALQGQAKVLAEQEQVLRQEVEALQAPEALAGRAEALGMVPGGPPAFLRLSDGEVLGSASPAPAAPARRPARGGAAATGPAAPTADAGTTLERLLSRAPVETDEAGTGRSDDATGGTGRAGGTSSTGQRGADGATGDRASSDGATGDRASADGATGDRASSDGATGDRAADEGAVDDGATDTDDGTGTAASTSTSTGARR